MRNERGSALIVALVVVVIAVGIAGAFLADTAIRTRMQTLAVESDTAQMIADAAVEKVRRALWVYKTQNTYSWDQILQDHAGLSTDPDGHVRDYQERMASEDFAEYRRNYDSSGADTANDAPLPADADFFLGVTRPFAEGGYHCVIRDNDDGDGDPMRDSDNRLLLYVTAALPDGTHRQVLVLVEYLPSNYTPDHAILVDGSIRFNGNPAIGGALGSAHANGDITIVGSGTTFTVSANATGVVEEGTASTPPQGFNEGVATVAIPEIVPSQHRTLADYLLQSDGNVRIVATGAVVSASGRGGWNNWSYNHANHEWRYSGSSTACPAGTYYVEGNAQITGGSAVLTITVIAEGSISTTGNSHLRPYVSGTLFLAGGDVRLGGTAGTTYQGLIAAQEQLGTGGTFDHQGVLLARNAVDVSRTVSSGTSFDSDFGGSITVTYDGGLSTLLPNPDSSVRVRAVRRLR